MENATSAIDFAPELRRSSSEDLRSGNWQKDDGPLRHCGPCPGA